MGLAPKFSMQGRLAYLRVESSSSGLEAELTIGTEREQFAAHPFDCAQRPELDLFRVSPEEIEQASAAFVAEVLDPSLRRALEQWSKGQTEDPVLIVTAVDGVCARLPWELLPAGLRAPTLFVVRAPELDLDLEQQDGEWLEASGVAWR